MTAFAHETVLELSYDEESLARIVERSVAREVGEIDDERSQTTVDRDGDTVTFAVEARDLTALRAATNTWLRLATVAERTAALAG
jgi:KEOPS complex subunit Pcc1